MPRAQATSTYNKYTQQMHATNTTSQRRSGLYEATIRLLRFQSGFSSKTR